MFATIDLHLYVFVNNHLFCACTDGNVLQFEDGYLVETVVQGNELGVMPYKIRVSQEGELFAVDADKSNIVRITPPLSQCEFRYITVMEESLCLFLIVGGSYFLYFYV